MAASQRFFRSRLGRVEMWRGGCRFSMSVSDPFVYIGA
jgi:hypothetical protein